MLPFTGDISVKVRFLFVAKTAIFSSIGSLFEKSSFPALLKLLPSWERRDIFQSFEDAIAKRAPSFLSSELVVEGITATLN